MRWLTIGLLAPVLVTGAAAQQYVGYPPSQQWYYAPYSPPPMTVVYPAPQVLVQTVPAMVVAQDYAPAAPVTYMIAFKDNMVRLAAAYWVRDNVLYYVTPEHRQKSVPLDCVDRSLSERLNIAQNVLFQLPVSSGRPELWRVLARQLNLVLDTQETPRGVLVRISDTLFQVNDYHLTAQAREKLAKIAGILVSYQGLCPHLQGFTDNTGPAGYNLELSRKRADAVRGYLVSQGVPASSLSAVGLGSADPVASNATAQGRQRNRRVEMLISGESIGIASTGVPTE